MWRGIITVAVATAGLASLSCDDDDTAGPTPVRRIWQQEFSVGHGLEVAGVRDLWFCTADDGWACYGPIVLRYRDGEWSHFYNFYDIYYTLILRAVCARGADDVWAGGTLSPYEGDDALFHYDGARWRPVDVPGLGAVYDLYFFDGGTGWVAGDGGLFYYDGASWTPHLSGVFRSLSFVSPTEGWACSREELYRWKGTSWEKMTPPTTEALRGVCIPETDCAWVYTPYNLYYYDGREWWDGWFPGTDIEAAHFNGRYTGWVVTRNATFRYYAPWECESYEYPLDHRHDLLPYAVSVFVTDAGDVWAGSMEEWEMLGGEMWAFGYLYHAPAPN